MINVYDYEVYTSYSDGLFYVFQFAMHYSWSTEARARQALANISALLRPGGTFIGTMPDANVIIKRLRECMPLSSTVICLISSN